MKKLVYIAHPLRGNIEENLKSVTRWARWAAVERNVCPVAPYFLYCHALDDGKKEERKLGMSFNFLVLPLCDEVWVCGKYDDVQESEGILEEVEYCHRFSIPVFNHSTDNGNPPWEEEE